MILGGTLRTRPAAIAVGVVLLLSIFASSAAAPVQGRELTTIRLIARTLNRLGEKEVAKRLLSDYTQNKRVRFGDLGGEGVNAETGRGRSGRNEMELDRSMLRIGELERLLTKRPYGSASPLVSAAVTIFHEYQHMDQTDPQNTPKFEDPAWSTTDAAMARWAELLDREWKATFALPASPSRTAKLQEIGDLIKQLISEGAALKEGIQRNAANGTLSKGRVWKIDRTMERLRTIQSGAAAAPSAGWVLVDVIDFNQKPTDANYVLSYARGSIGWKWSLNKDVFAFQCTWSEPPKTIPKSGRIPIDLAVTVTQNAGTDYSANGNFSVWFDRPDIEPGAVGSPISLTNEKGESGGFDVSHAPAASRAPQARRLYIDGSKLSGRKGAKIALIVCAYNGRTAGTKYIYEWRD